MRKYIRRVALILALALLATLMSGCRKTDYVENQAYAVLLGIDIAEGGGVELTVKYPMLAGASGGGGGSSGGSGGGSSYASSSARGTGFQQALDELRIGMPRQINLSALTLIVVSEELAATGALKDIMDELAVNYRMYSSAYFAVCQGKAGEFIKKQEPLIGSRLSEGLSALIENGNTLGSIPASRIADVYFRTGSAYSDPLAMLCALSESGGEGGGETGAQYAADAPVESESKNIYLGSCVMRDGRAVLKLDGLETMIANLLQGDLTQFSYTREDDAAYISIDKGPEIRVKTGERPSIEISMSISAMITAGNADAGEIAAMLEADVTSVIDMCRQACAEPFGFADRAASSFATMEDWINYDWRNRFTECDVDVNIEAVEIFG